MLSEGSLTAADACVVQQWCCSHEGRCCYKIRGSTSTLVVDTAKTQTMLQLLIDKLV